MSGFAPAGLLPAFVLPEEFRAPQETGVLRWASLGYLSRPEDDPPNAPWEPRLLGEVEVSQSATDLFGIGGQLTVSVADIGIADADNVLANLDRWGLADGREVRIRAIPVVEAQASDYGTPLAGAALGLSLDAGAGLAALSRTDPDEVFTGVTAAVVRQEGRTGVLRLTDMVQRLATPLQPMKYGGTGGLDGGDAHEGKPRPVCLGFVFNCAPVYLGEIDLGVGIGPFPTFQVHWRGVEEVVAVRIRGVTQALVTGTPTVGQARAFASRGLFQLGSTPDGTVTADVRGDNEGGYVSSLAGVVRRLLTSLGPQLEASLIDAAAFALAEIDLPGEIGWYLGAQEATAAEACQALVQHCGAVLGGSRSGRLRLFDPLALDAPQFDLPPALVLACRPLEMPISLRPLPHAVAVGWGRNFTPLEDIAGAVPDTDRTRLGQEQSGPARADSGVIIRRVAQQRELAFRGLYRMQADALARAAKWRRFLEAAPMMWEIVTDRLLHQVECGHVGRFAYPAWGLARGLPCTVVGWAEQVAARRLTMIVVTQPEVA